MDAGRSSISYYERALAAAPDYAAAHHYLAHALENLGQPAQALSHARRFAELAPEVPHAHHMYGHALRQVDRMREAVAAFTKADTLHTAYAQRERIAPAFDWAYRHNLDLLGAAHQYLGHMTRAETTLRQSFGLASIGPFGQEQEVYKRAWPLFLIARGRINEALDAAHTLQSHDSPLLRALGHVLASRTLVAAGRLDAAATEGNQALRNMKAMGPLGGTLLPDFELSQGEYLLRTGESDKGRAMRRDAVAKLRADRSPDRWTATLFEIEAVARAARALDDWTLAADMAQAMRQHDPYYPGTQYALALVAERRGDRTAARTAFAEAIRRWQEADAGLPDLTDAQARQRALGP